MEADRPPDAKCPVRQNPQGHKYDETATAGSNIGKASLAVYGGLRRITHDNIK